jgi:hypothetical protein
MRALSRLGNKKNGLSNVVAYVLLISITLSLSVFVYGWLKFYVSEDDMEGCPSGVNIIIKDYECVLPDSEGEGGRLSVTLKNKGLFTIGGYVLRVHDRPDANFGFYVFNEAKSSRVPGMEWSDTYYFSEHIVDGYELQNVTFLEVQPFVLLGAKVNCQVHASQKVVCE